MKISERDPGALCGKRPPEDRARMPEITVCICRNEKGRRKAIVCSPLGEHPVRFLEIEPLRPRNCGVLRERSVSRGAVFQNGDRRQVRLGFGMAGPKPNECGLPEAVVVIDGCGENGVEVAVEVAGMSGEGRFLDTRGGGFQRCGLSVAPRETLASMVERAEHALTVQAVEEPAKAVERSMEMA